MGIPHVCRAQGNLSTQGLGYSPGQLSTAAGSMGGGISEIDPFSPLNPAAIGLMTSAIVYFQAEPEYRKLQIGAQEFTSTVTRFRRATSERRGGENGPRIHS